MRFSTREPTIERRSRILWRLPQKIEHPFHHVRAARLFATHRIVNGILTEAICPALVAAHARADLVTPRTVLPREQCAGFHPIQPLVDHRDCLAHVGLALPATLPGLHYARGDMRKAAAVLMLVPILAAFAGSAEPLHSEFTFSAHACVDVERVEHGNRNGARVDSAGTLGRGNALNAVAARLIVESR